MAMMTAIGLFVLSLLTAVLTKIAGEEVEAWSPFIIRRLIKLAVSWLPEKRSESGSTRNGEATSTKCPEESASYSRL